MSSGTFGDFLGGVLNPLLTFLMFMGVLITIVLQQKELRLTRQELKNSSLALQEQAITQERQRFENTFFSLLGQHNIILQRVISGDRQSIVTKLKKSIFLRPQDMYNNNRTINATSAKAALLNGSDEINQYFRILYQILKLIATSCPTSTIRSDFTRKNIKDSLCSKEEKSYSNIVRAFLTDDVYYLLLVNCYCVGEDDTFVLYKNVLERYAFLEHINFFYKENNFQNDLLRELINSYDKSAFGQNKYTTT